MRTVNVIVRDNGLDSIVHREAAGSNGRYALCGCGRMSWMFTQVVSRHVTCKRCLAIIWSLKQNE